MAFRNSLFPRLIPLLPSFFLIFPLPSLPLLPVCSCFPLSLSHPLTQSHFSLSLSLSAYLLSAYLHLHAPFFPLMCSILPFSLYVCFFFSLSLSLYPHVLSFSLSLSLSLFLSLYLPLSVSLNLSLSISFSLSIYIYISLFFCLSKNKNTHILYVFFVFTSPYLFMSIPLPLSHPCHPTFYFSFPSISEQPSSPFNSDFDCPCVSSHLSSIHFMFPFCVFIPFSLVFSLSISSQIFPSSLLSSIPIPTPSCLLSSLHSHPSHHLVHLCSSFFQPMLSPSLQCFFIFHCFQSLSLVHNGWYKQETEIVKEGNIRNIYFQWSYIQRVQTKSTNKMEKKEWTQTERNTNWEKWLDVNRWCWWWWWWCRPGTCTTTFNHTPSGSLGCVCVHFCFSTPIHPHPTNFMTTLKKLVGQISGAEVHPTN